MQLAGSSVYVVIVNWERPHDTIECVRSVQASDVAQLEILVVDNGSTDDSMQQISQACPGVTLLALPRNLGFAGGYNAGIECALASGAEFVFILNNDTTIEPMTIRALVAAPWDVCVPKILRYHEPGRIWAAGARWRRFPPSVVMLGYGILEHGEADGPQWDSPRPLDYATGCALMIKRRVLKEVGGFDPDFENYMEDYDFCHRVRAVGYSIGYVPKAKVFHKVSQALGLASPRWWWYMGRNTVLFYRKGRRFSSWQLWSFASWVTLRETVKGNVSCLPHFWRGVKNGLEFLEQKWSE